MTVKLILRQYKGVKCLTISIEKCDNQTTKETGKCWSNEHIASLFCFILFLSH